MKDDIDWTGIEPTLELINIIINIGIIYLWKPKLTRICTTMQFMSFSRKKRIKSLFYLIFSYINFLLNVPFSKF